MTCDTPSIPVEYSASSQEALSLVVNPSFRYFNITFNRFDIPQSTSIKSASTAVAINIPDLYTSRLKSNGHT